MSKRVPISNMGAKAGVRGFKKGVSGNPGGYSKAARLARRIAAEMISAETEGGKEIIDFAIKVMRGTQPDIEAEDAKSRRWAADFLADRLWGKSPLIVELGDKPDPLPTMADLTDIQLEALAVLDEAVPVADSDPDDEDDGKN